MDETHIKLRTCCSNGLVNCLAMRRLTDGFGVLKRGFDRQTNPLVVDGLFYVVLHHATD